MLTIRLARGGAKKRPFYHFVVADQRRPLGGRYIERIGYYNPLASGKDIPILIDLERVAFWTNQGAQPTARVQSLIKELAQKAA
jgi:small subunit ribosomal protein S16